MLTHLSPCLRPRPSWGQALYRFANATFFYTRLFVLSAMLLPILAGCESYARPLGGTNPTIINAKQGQDCRVHVFGIGGMPDVSGILAMRSGGISKLRSDEYRANAFAGVGRECMIAHGE